MKKFFTRVLICIMAIASCFSVYGCGGRNNKPTAASEAEVLNLRVNSMTNPLGIDSAPIFSWNISSGVRGTYQKSYRLTLADSEANLKNGKFVWDTGYVESSATANIAYGGSRVLQPYTEYFWSVSIRNQDGKEFSCSAPAKFETGVIWKGFDEAEWISANNEFDERALSTEGMCWIWKTNGKPQGLIDGGTQYFRKEFTLNASKKVSSAYVAFTADDYGAVYLNGIKVGEHQDVTNSWQSGTVVEVTDALTSGKNTVAAKITNKDAGYAGLLARVAIFYTDGSMEAYASDKTWRVSDSANDGCLSADYTEDDSWQAPEQASAYGTDIWSNNVSFRYNSADVTSAPMLRRSFMLKSEIVKARVYATAAGIYDLYINGERVGDALLTPGASEFTEHLYYQTYDVTKYVKSGANVMGAMLGNGWYRSGIMRSYEVAEPAFIGKLIVTYSDGTTQTVASDGLWRSNTDGPVIYNDFYNGEDYDANKEPIGWSSSEFDDSAWDSVTITNAQKLGVGEIIAEECGQVKVMDVLTPVAMTTPKEGVYIYDFGQNFAGNVQITVKGERNQKITLRYGEMLNDDSGTGDGDEGTLYTANLRTARSTDSYILRGDEGGETWSPTFTYHGFRYLEITGIDGALPISDVKGLVIYSDMEDAMTFSCSNELINQLASNTYWGQRSNFLSVPTDCPQRDERSGWLGDAQIFAGTASYYMNVKQFYSHYIQAMNDGQWSNGAFADVAPGTKDCAEVGHGGWADAGVIIPYVMYTRYGDKSILVNSYSNMSRYVEFLVNDAGSDFIRDNLIFYGDWLSIDETTPTEVTDSAYCVYTCDLMTEIATVLDKPADAQKFAGYAASFRNAWCNKYLNGDGSTKCNTQTSYVLGIHFGIIPENLREAAGNKLVENLASYNYTLRTGFLGVSYLLPALCETGHEDIAFTLLEQVMYPSWLYPVLQGATTIWERWNSYTKEDGFGPVGMNSFNHYSYGSVMEWVYNTVLGINYDSDNPGFTNIILKPTVGGTLTFAKGSYLAQSGLIESAWQKADGKLTYTCTVPANATATLYLPVSSSAAVVYEGSSLAADATGVTYAGYENGCMVYKLVSGTYSFTTAA